MWSLVALTLGCGHYGLFPPYSKPLILHYGNKGTDYLPSSLVLIVKPYIYVICHHNFVWILGATFDLGLRSLSVSLILNRWFLTMTIREQTIHPLASFWSWILLYVIIVFIYYESLTCVVLNILYIQNILVCSPYSKPLIVNCDGDRLSSPASFWSRLPIYVIFFIITNLPFPCFKDMLYMIQNINKKAIE